MSITEEFRRAPSAPSLVRHVVAAGGVVQPGRLAAGRSGCEPASQSGGALDRLPFLSVGVDIGGPTVQAGQTRL